MKIQWIIGTLGVFLLVTSLLGNAWLGATLRTYRYNTGHGWYTDSDGVREYPMMGLSLADLQQMLYQIDAVEKDAKYKGVLTVSVLGKNTVEVTTGELEGPLSGIGRSFRFNRTSDGWKLDEKFHCTWIA